MEAFRELPQENGIVDEGTHKFKTSDSQFY